MVKKYIRLRNADLRNRACRAIQEAPEGMRMVLEPDMNKRSLNQLAYLFGVVYERIRYHLAETGLADEVYSAEAIHEMMKQKFLPAQVIEISGEKIIITRTTTRLSLVEMRDFIELIVHYAADEWECYIPAPSEQFDEMEVA